MTGFGCPRRHVAECASTNDLARAWAADASDPAPHGALVTADFQTRGRGRRGRGWDAAPGQSALMSFVLRPNLSLADAWQIGFLAALAAAEALRGMGLDARLKWPNDVLLHGAKVAGALVETILTPPELGAGGRSSPPALGAGGQMAAIAGIGVNVNQPGFHAADYAYPPTSLRLVTGREQSVEEIIQAVAAALGRWDALYRQGGFAPVLSTCQTYLAVGAIVRRGVETATLTGLTSDGHARVRLSDGTFAEWTALEG